MKYKIREDGSGDINELAKEIHANAVTKGFWPPPNTYQYCDWKYSFDQICNKLLHIHSEITEAYECCIKGEYDLFIKDGKPEGLPVELADVVIRALDLCCALEIRITQDASLATVVYELETLRTYIDYALESMRDNDMARFSRSLNTLVYSCFKAHSNTMMCVKSKMEYNRTRPYKHGRKA